ncbi:MAG: pre-toxin TG domain-containing protein, partial [Byssovorax sp.]
PDDPASYALGASNVPWVDVPDISGVPDAFSPGNDPYAAYAAKVIATLAADVSGGKVTARADFVANVRAWRANQAALQQALAMRASVSQAETSAFLNGLNSVTAYVKQFMDASDWFLDTSAPPALRAYIDGVLKQGFGQLSDEMKDNLNIWSEDSIDLSQTQLFQTISAFGGAMSTIGEGITAYAEVMQTLVTATSRIGVGFVPFVGPALDLCECVTGKAWCLPSGKELSTGERIFSGAGVAVGSVAHFYAGVKNAGVSPAATLIAGEVAKVDEAIALGLHANPRTWYKTLRGAASEIKEPFEKTAAKWMQTDGRALIGIGDDGVRKVLGIPKESPALTDLGKAADFLSVTKGNKLAISEVKSLKDIAETKGGIDADMAIKQLSNTMAKLTELGLAGDVERVEIFLPSGVSFNDADLKVAADGVLTLISTGKRVTLKGFKNFIMVIRL